jgi:23S rRNA (adenine2503-C2)-methyltransferase
MLIYDLDLPALTRLLKDRNEPAYRAKQVWQGLYQHFYDSTDQFTNLPKSLRKKLGPLFASPIKPKLYLDSSDGQTRKTLFELHDGQVIGY